MLLSATPMGSLGRGTPAFASVSRPIMVSSGAPSSMSSRSVVEFTVGAAALWETQTDGEDSDEVIQLECRRE
jgi:hypothetical protein